eukprot:361412-Chlamydomonas_euryale.AAC.4
MHCCPSSGPPGIGLQEGAPSLHPPAPQQRWHHMHLKLPASFTLPSPCRVPARFSPCNRKLKAAPRHIHRPLTLNPMRNSTHSPASAHRCASASLPAQPRGAAAPPPARLHAAARHPILTAAPHAASTQSLHVLRS